MRDRDNIRGKQFADQLVTSCTGMASR